MGRITTRWNPSPWRKLIPRAITVLGEVTTCALHDPSTGRFLNWEPKAGTVLTCDPNGDNLYFVRPLAEAPGKEDRSRDPMLVKAIGLHERFMHRKADGYYNALIKPARKPRFVGELVIIRYVATKDIDEETEGQEAEWEHYFEQPGVAPAYAKLWNIGLDQFWVPPGPWRVTPEGIAYAPPPLEEAHGTSSPQE